MAGILDAIEVSSRGLTVQRTKMNTVAQNLANAETTKTEDGGPYRRRRVVVNEERTDRPFTSFLQRADTKLARTHEGHRPGRMLVQTETTEISTAECKEVVDPDSDFRRVYDPSHPQADEDGYVLMPDVEVINEMVDMMSASRAYEANANAIASAKQMVEDALDI